MPKSKVFARAQPRLVNVICSRHRRDVLAAVYGSRDAPCFMVWERQLPPLNPERAKLARERGVPNEPFWAVADGQLPDDGANVAVYCFRCRSRGDVSGRALREKVDKGPTEDGKPRVVAVACSTA